MSNANRDVQVVGGIPGLIREHWPWAVGLVPILFASVRLLVVSGGDRQILGELVQDLDVVGLVLASVLPFLSTLLFWAMFFWMGRRHELKAEVEKSGKKADFAVNALYVLLAWIITILLLLLATPAWLLFANVAVVVVVAIFAIVARKPLENRGKFAQVSIILSAAIVAIGIVLGIIALTLSPVITGMWLPKEKISVRSPQGLERSDGYVLSTDRRWTRFLTPDKRVVIVKSDTVERRRPIQAEPSGWSRTVSQIWF